LNVAFVSACAKAQAETVPNGPPLAVPAPPPRVLAPVQQIVEAAPPPALEPAEAPRTPPRQTPPPERRAETPPPAAAPPPAPAATPAPGEVREVRAMPAASAAAEDRKVRELLGQASRILLNQVEYRKLSAEGQSQYNQSKRFAEQAEEALKVKNFVYAMTLADKAVTLARELAGSR
jgi:hypothetical protein